MKMLNQLLLAATISMVILACSNPSPEPVSGDQAVTEEELTETPPVSNGRRILHGPDLTTRLEYTSSGDRDRAGDYGGEIAFGVNLYETNIGSVASKITPTTAKDSIGIYLRTTKTYVGGRTEYSYRLLKKLARTTTLPAGQVWMILPSYNYARVEVYIRSQYRPNSQYIELVALADIHDVINEENENNNMSEVIRFTNYL